MMLVCLTATAGYAQQVLVENGKIVIDASAIPNTQVKKARTTDGTNTKRGTNDATNISSVVSDEKVYYKFELSPTRFTATWQDAVNRCKDLADDGGGWRLPTHKEAVLIYILWPELRKAGLTGAAGGTGTDAGGDGTTCPYVTYDNNGTIKMAGKSESSNFYRCIRDL